MPTKVLVPLLGEGVEEVTIVAWLKAEGDVVDEFEGLLEVETDKVVTEIPSPADGVLLQILEAEEEKSVSVGTLLAWIGEAGETVPDGDETPEEDKPAPVVEEAVPVPEPVPSTSVVDAAPIGRDSALGFISPVVAKIAAENNIDLQNVSGTGRGGRITKADVLAYESKPKAASVSSAAPASTLKGGTILPMTSVRRSIAKHMVESRRTSPHVTTVMEVDFSGVMAHRKANKEAFARDGVKLTFTPYFVAATVTALKAFPIANSSWRDDGIVLHKDINIGMATSLGEDGLIVPVIKNAERLSLLGLAQTVNDLAERARTKKLKPEEVRDGTFSITNHGVSGSLFAMPIINQPQVAILGVGAIQKRVVVVSDANGNDMIAIRPMVYLTLTFDHRVLDGAVADYFLGEVVGRLEGSW
ncbi:MAG: 2-oxo acid dehydrogenase subunit E2 [Anaerolineae bacterium]|jgi:pyruvate/2-oxoglutarate dehydrogenase complex dihydrolipoamide acyltransferase (E2) component|nr:2-oxo acid dehydrogenase subunit E2 [Anaerolineae bacterium]MBT7072425.1 2-oxo acid dehydrogenase subunit E2 [Anaerolineae bacterium]MBT7326578.1 2-oxo acid dehydrogenase subunit E2 [Anaerolineae bacterium]